MSASQPASSPNEATASNEAAPTGSSMIGAIGVHNFTMTGFDSPKEVSIKKVTDEVVTKASQRIIKRVNEMPPSMSVTEDMHAEFTQPTSLPKKDKALFNQMKLYFLLQERRKLRKKCHAFKGEGECPVASGYPPFLCPFSNFVLERRPAKSGRRKRRRKASRGGATTAGGGMKGKGGEGKGAHPHSEDVDLQELLTFENVIESVDKSFYADFKEKLRKVTAGAMLEGLYFKGIRQEEVLPCILPDAKYIVGEYNRRQDKGYLLNTVTARVMMLENLEKLYKGKTADTANQLIMSMPDVPNTVAMELHKLNEDKIYSLTGAKLDNIIVEIRNDLRQQAQIPVGDEIERIVLPKQKHLEMLKGWAKGATSQKQMNLPFDQTTNFVHMRLQPEPDKEGDKGGKKGKSDANDAKKKA